MPEEDLSILFESLKQGVVYHNRDGQIVKVNKAASEILGLSYNQILGLSSTDPAWKTIHKDGSNYPGETHPAVVALNTGKPVINSLMGVYNVLSQSYKWISINAFPQFEEGNKIPTGSFAIFEDITDRLKAEEALQNSLARNKALLDANPDIMFVFSEEGRIIDYHTNYENLLYSKPDLFLGKLVDEILPPEIAELSHLKIKSVLGEKKPDYATYQMEVGGQMKDFEARYVVHNTDEVLAIVRDITDQKKSEKELHHREKILESVAKASQFLLQESPLEININLALKEIGQATNQDRVYVFEFHKHPESAELLMSQRYELVKSGISLQIDNPELQNMIVAELFPRWYSNFVKGELITGNICDFPEIERKILEPQDIISILVVPVTIENSCWGFVGFDNCHAKSNWGSFDISLLSAIASSIGMAIVKQKRENEILHAKKLMEASEERFRIIINNSSDVLGIVNPDGSHQFISQAIERITGYSVNELMKEQFGKLIHPEDKEKVMIAFREGVQNPKRVISIGYRLAHKTKGWIDAEANGLNLVYEPAIKGILLSVRDITERKKAEKALRISEERYALVIEATEQGLWDWDLEKNQIYFSPKWKKQIGYKDHELKNEFSVWVEHLHPEDTDYCQKAVQDYLENPTEYFILDFRFRHKNGEYRWIHNKASSIKNSEGRVIRMFGAHTDITEQKNAQIALRESETFRSILLETMPIPFFYKDIHGRYLGFNKAFEDFFGERRDFLLGKSVFEINPPELAAIYHAQDKLLFDKPTNQVYESKVKNHKGDLRDVIFHKATLTDTKGKTIGLIGTILDITERNKAVDGLRQSEQNYKHLMELFRNLADNMPDMLWAKDLENKYIFVNKAICNKLLIADDTNEPIGKDDMFFAMRQRQLHQDKHEWHTFGEICMNSDSVVLNSGKTGQFEEFGNVQNKFLFLDVIKTPLRNENGEIIGIVGSARDVTERKRDEKILKIQYNIAMAMVTVENLEQLVNVVLEELNQILDTTNFFVALYDSAKDILRKVIWKDEKDDYKEWPAEDSLSGQVVKQSKTLLYTRKEIQEFARKNNLSLKGTMAECWLGVPLKIGNRVFGAMVIQSYYNENAYDTSSANLLEIIAYELSIFIDKYRIFEDLIASKEKAEEGERLKTAFLQNISHEIRTPMNAISGFSQMLDMPHISDDKRSTYISIIIKSVNQLLAIVENILTISAIETKQEKAKIEKVNLNEIFNDLFAIFKIQADERKLSLFAKTGLSDEQSEIYTDKAKVAQIISNLLINAFKFTHGGYIEFGYSLEEPEKQEIIPERVFLPDTIYVESGYVDPLPGRQLIQFYVKDSGIGIKPDNQTRIFERFMQAESSIQNDYGGAGLGLSISKGFVELLGGKIWLKSEYGKGSEFYFTLPFHAVSDISKTRIQTNKINKMGTVLIVEDHETNFLLLKELLMSLKLDVIHAWNGKESIEICQSNPEISLVLMDIKMPAMDGHSAARYIKETHPELPIIAQSAYALEHEIEKYSDVFNDYITKPIDVDEFFKIMKKYVEIL